MVIGLIILVAIFADVLAPYSMAESVGGSLEPPSNDHWFGTDALGRDVFSRVLIGTRIVLGISLLGTAAAVVIGGLLGLVIGYLGGSFEALSLRLIEAMIAIPLMFLALLAISAAGPSRTGSVALLVGVLILVYAPRVATVANKSGRALRDQAYVSAAILRGEGAWSIIWHEILPNSTGSLLVEFGVRAGYAPILVGSLGFLGFGARPPSSEWGLMISEGRAALASAPHAVLPPAIAIAILVIAINTFVDGLARLRPSSSN